MSYYGASGSKHVYVATDQPLYGLGSEPGAPQGKRIQTVTDSPELMSALPAIESAKVSKFMALKTGRACPGLVLIPTPVMSLEGDTVTAGYIRNTWMSQGLFVVIFRNGPDYIGCKFDGGAWDPNVHPSATAWRLAAMTPNDIGKILGREDAYVWGMPYGKNDWAPYKEYIDAENPTVGAQPWQFPGLPPFQFPEVPGTTPPVTTPPAAESRIGLVHIGIGIAFVFLTWKLLQGGEEASYEANVDDFEENCWE